MTTTTDRAQEQNEIRRCLIAYRNARDANDGEQLAYAGEVYRRLSAAAQSVVEATLEDEYPMEEV